ncbi:MAG: DUF4838 domain-containing protein [Lentisphaeria bacterium]|nr:DUF4838 domain-containing protein [Lentisphaeria bacterium]
MPKTLPIALLALLALSPGLRAQEDNIDVWDNQPLGPTVPIPPVGPPRVNRELKSNRVSQPLAGAPVLLAENGRARAAIVIPAKSEERQYVAAERAARLLQAKVQAASQATLPIVSHDDSQTSRLVDGKLRVTADNQVFDYAVLIGDHPFAADNGVAAKSLPEEGFLLKTAGNALCIAGDHDSAIYAVIDLLEQYGFRTLWPGELGTVVPKLPTFAVQPVQVSDAPALHQRHMRSADTYKPREWNLPADRQEWFTPAELGPYDDYGDRPLTGLYNLKFAPRHMQHWAPAKAEWSLWQRLGGSRKVGAGHAFNYAWGKYGQDHLDYFALLKNGSRHPLPKDNPHRVQLCFSKPEVIDAIANDRIEALKAGATSVASLSPSDGGGGNAPCMCVRCRRLDIANAEPITLPSGDPYVAISDRHFHCFNLITEKIIAAIPDAQVAVIAYSQYRNAPLVTEIHPKLIVGFVGLSYHDADYNQNCREHWDRWANKAMQLYWRPNLFYGTKGILAVYATEMARDIKHLYQTGMIGTDIDTFGQDWATLGLNYYMVPKLLWNPAADPEEIIQDYCRTGFGPAAETVRHYFAEVEKISARAAREVSARAKAQAMADADNDDPARGRLHWGAFAAAYSPADIERLGAILNRAQQAAQPDETIARRVDFLRAGLNFTAIRARAFDVCFQNPGSKEEKIAAVNEQYEYFKTLYLKYPLAVNVAFLGWWDANTWTKQGLKITPENHLLDR